MSEESEDERREEAISSTPCLQSGFKSSRVSQIQLSKLQELHKKRLKIKSKFQNKSKGGTSRSHGKYLKHYVSKDSGTSFEDSSIGDSKSQHDGTNLSAEKENVAADNAPKKRQKLHWGLDTKERWEMKANM